MIFIFSRLVLGYQVISLKTKAKHGKKVKAYQVFFLGKLLAIYPRWRQAVEWCERETGLKYRAKTKETGSAK